MNLDELKKNLRDVIERYHNKAEFTGEVCRDVMARDCLHVVEELEAENDALRKRVKELEESLPKWVSVNKDCPIEYKKVLVSNPSAHTSKIAWKYRGHWFFDTNCDILKPTHWQPLPPPPTTEDSSAIEKEK